MDAFLGEIRMFGFSWAPRDWAYCNGATMLQAQNQALYSVLGATYGGDATTFNLPALQGRAPVGATAATTGTMAGQNVYTVGQASMPAHSHPFLAATDVAADMSSTVGYQSRLIRRSDNVVIRSFDTPTDPLVQFSGGVGPAGAPSQSVSPAPPFIALNICMCVTSTILPVRPTPP